MSDRDARCGCPIVRVAANRRDRRRMQRIRRDCTPYIRLHQVGCPLGDGERSDGKTRTEKEAS